MPLDYLMHHRWQVYDVNIDGISLIANYRATW
jgi:ABC-type transporter MlaC component